MIMPFSKPRLALLFLMVAVAPLLRAQGAYDSLPATFEASTLLGAAALKGPHYEIAEAVKTDPYFHQFTLTSDYGPFDATGRTVLTTRIQEIAALASLEEVSKTEVFLAAAGNSVVKIGQGAMAAVSNPEATVKGLGAGIKRFGVNLGRRTERAASSAGDENQVGGNAAAGAAGSVLGVNAAMRRWAQKVGVDPYTTNAVLRKALDDIAKVDAAGSIATKVAVPVPGVVGLTSTVGSIVWSKDPEEVRKMNEEGLRTLGVRDAVAKSFFANRWLTLTYQTRFVTALGGAKVPGVADYVESAAGATTEREALFFVETAEMLPQWSTHEKADRVLTDSRALVVASAGGRVRALLPLDWLPWTAETEKALKQAASRAKSELGGTTLELALTGRPSDRASKEMSAVGWTVVPAEVKR
jgi:hypothetical protein